MHMHRGRGAKSIENTPMEHTCVFFVCFSCFFFFSCVYVDGAVVVVLVGYHFADGTYHAEMIVVSHIHTYANTMSAMIAAIRCSGNSQTKTGRDA